MTGCSKRVFRHLPRHGVAVSLLPVVNVITDELVCFTNTLIKALKEAWHANI